MQRVLITGAAGGIGGRLRQTLRGRYPILRLSDVKPLGEAGLGEAGPGEEIDRTDLGDLAAVERMMDGVDGVVHLGAVSSEDSWENILEANIVGAYNVFEAARRRNVERVVFATTNHVVGFYRRDRRLDNAAVPRPDSRYGVSKAFGEALGAFYADKFGLRVLCIRIGNVADKPVDKRRLSIWISPRDMTQLVRIGLEHPALHFEIVYGVSNNVRSWWDDPAARRLGYRPRDRAEDYAAEVLRAEAGRPVDEIAELFQGGPFAAHEFDGDLDRL
ncbi:MAG: NAD(P)-dependent oxidoreductase [Proteobacteria bacterium]|nr:NAD(P)-dependent oxidoreductase [Pseudomonadota bacterium]